MRPIRLWMARTRNSSLDHGFQHEVKVMTWTVRVVVLSVIGIRGRKNLLRIRSGNRVGKYRWWMKSRMRNNVSKFWNDLISGIGPILRSVCSSIQSSTRNSQLLQRAIGITWRGNSLLALILQISIENRVGSPFRLDTGLFATRRSTIWRIFDP